MTVVLPYPATGSPDVEGTSRITKLLKTMQTYSTPALTDNLAQQLVQSLSGALDQPVNIERQPTGNTIAGTSHVVNARPDGYTLLFTGNPTVTIFPATYPQLPFNPHRDLAPVALFARMPLALIARSGSSITTVRELVARARRMPGQINYAVLGEGTTSRLTGEFFGATSRVEIVHVNYNGSVPAINAVITDNVDFGFVPLTSVLPFLNGGAVRVIALTTGARHISVPAVPTLAESGLPGFDAAGWFGVFAQSGVSGAIIAQLNSAINRALSEDMLSRTLSKLGLDISIGTPGEFQTLIKNDTERWGRLIKAPSLSP